MPGALVTCSPDHSIATLTKPEIQTPPSKAQELTPLSLSLGGRRLRVRGHGRPQQKPTAGFAEREGSRRAASASLCWTTRLPLPGQGPRHRSPGRGLRIPNPRLPGLPRERGQKRLVQALMVLFQIVLRVGRRSVGSGRYPRSCLGDCLVSLDFKKEKAAFSR